MRTGLIGGTFNPVHNAHLQIAEESLLHLGLDRVIFIPANDPPHKPVAGDISFNIRIKMVLMAIKDNKNFSVSDIEQKREGKSYSIDTIYAFRKLYPEDDLYFIIGSDSFMEIGLWHRFSTIFSCCNLIVVERPGREVEKPFEALPVAIQGEFRYTFESRRLVHFSGHTVDFISGHKLDISSSQIRKLAATAGSIAGLVPAQVEAYIIEEGIYNRCR